MRTDSKGGRSVAARAVVVDDHADSAAMLAEVLTMRGVVVEVAHDGEGALAAIARHAPQLVLLDLSLPGGLDGYEVAARIRADHSVSPVRVVAVTGWTGPEASQRALDGGFDAHLAKPVDLGALMALVDQIFEA